MVFLFDKNCLSECTNVIRSPFPPMDHFRSVETNDAKTTCIISLSCYIPKYELEVYIYRTFCWITYIESRVSVHWTCNAGHEQNVTKRK